MRIEPGLSAWKAGLKPTTPQDRDKIDKKHHTPVQIVIEKVLYEMHDIKSTVLPNRLAYSYSDLIMMEIAI